MIDHFNNPLEFMMKQAIEAAVHSAVKEAVHSDSYSKPLTVDLIERELYRTAMVAATNACEQLKTFVHNEWRLVQAEYERKAEMLSLRPPSIILPKD